MKSLTVSSHPIHLNSFRRSLDDLVDLEGPFIGVGLLRGVNPSENEIGGGHRRVWLRGGRWSVRRRGCSGCEVDSTDSRLFSLPASRALYGRGVLK